MLKQVLGSSIVIMMAISFSGCGSSGPTVKELQKTQQNIVKYDFPEIDPATEKQAIIRYSDLSKEIIKLSEYEKFKIGGGFGMHRAKGIEIGDTGSEIILMYLNGEVPVDRLREKKYLSQVVFKINYSKNNDKIIFNFPQSYEYIESKHPFGMVAETLDSFPNLESDAKNIYNNLSKIYIVSNKSYNLEGEVNSKYPATSIYSNFKRMIGEYRWRGNEQISEAKKSNTFNLEFQDGNFPLKVDVFPYREGSKVKYSVNLPYTLNSKGQGTLTKNEITTLKVKIEKIIND